MFVRSCSHVHQSVKLEQSWVFYLVYICLASDSVTDGRL